MNVLTFVLSLLLITSFGTSALLDKQQEARRVRSTFVGHLKANRTLLARSEKIFYRQFHSQPKTTKSRPSPNTGEKNHRASKVPPINPPCARLNLWPLVQEGPQSHPLLYETSAQLLKTLYGQALFDQQPRFEYTVLDLLLKTIKEKLSTDAPLELEKLSFEPHSFQMLYYKMLKGTKPGNGYPSLLDTILVNKEPSKICLFHAHPGQLAVFFGPKVAAQLFQMLHQSGSPPLTRAWLETLCAQHHVRIDPQIFEWFAWGKPKHRHSAKTTLIAVDADTQVTLKKNVYTQMHS